ncbi:radical SAM family protein [Aestuariispira insulae]|uniref:Radical SAM family protein n=2 Tax=Aestuariispira insulae TaxID=1461337 RepID=A0A3D9HZ26_9PROT|nr:radical SAM family protein [Aestuariispira insulae]
MLDYDEPLYRPPSEGRNLIIQATLGCSFNQCSFCSMYHSKTYQARPLDLVFDDIDRAAQAWPDASRVFLADGDAYILETDHLQRILEKLGHSFPNLTRVSAYATPMSLLRKSTTEMAELIAQKLSLVYFGIESGSPDILKRITKGASPKGMIKGLQKARNAGVKVSATVILGLGGKTLWQDHIDGTIALLNEAPVNYLSTLQLHLDRAAYPGFLEKFEDPFEFQDDHAILREQERLIQGLKPPSPVIYRSNHASNALALAGNLPKDREKLLDQIKAAQAGEQQLRPWFLRST